MVPFQAQSDHKQQRATAAVNLTKKRKWEQPKSLFDIELHLETPLPLDWQRCLDIQSGKIHFYNTTTQKRTSRDPRDSVDEADEEEEKDVCLDLELNLNCESLEKINYQTRFTRFMRSPVDQKTVQRPVFDGASEEMVAAVCMRCHLLVMLYKSSPECPNCKFMHAPDQTPHALFKRRCSLTW